MTRLQAEIRKIPKQLEFASKRAPSLFNEEGAFDHKIIIYQPRLQPAQIFQFYLKTCARKSDIFGTYSQ